MKFKTTKKVIKDGYTNIIYIPYCSAQSLLRFVYPIAYTSDTYGWSCDYYVVEGVCISTGYDHIGRPVNRDMLTSYDYKAELINESSLGWDAKKQAVNELLSDFIQEATNV